MGTKEPLLAVVFRGLAMRGTPPHDKIGVIPALHGLVERLSAPDLTAAEANVLRTRLLGLLDALERVKSAGARATPRADRPPARCAERCVTV
jgi:hypothetical protein